MTRKILPHGCWPSPVTAEMVAGKSLRFGSLQADGGALYWCESRPGEGGRGVVMRASQGGDTEELLPPPWSARSKVHEYGGGEFLASGGRLFFVEADSQDIHELGAEAPPRRLTDEANTRFADMTLDETRNRLIAVMERHVKGSHQPGNMLAAIPAGEGGPRDVTLLAQGRDFYATPRISPDGRELAWLEWDLPHMPWEQAELHVAAIGDDGTLGPSIHVAGGDGSAVFQPGWLADGRLAFVWDRSGWGRLHVREAGECRPVTPDGLDLMRPQWVFGMQSWTQLEDVRIACAFFDGGNLRLAAVDVVTGERDDIDSPMRSADALAPFGAGLGLVGATDTTPAGVLAIGAHRRIRTLRSAGESGLADKDLSIGQIISFDGDAGKVYAIWYPPANANVEAPQGERPPVIVMVHGGPTGMADRGLKMKIQFWTSRGFAVCDLDYSGSAGYGRAYRDRLEGNWGVLDLADVAVLANHLVDAGKADPERLLISGGSAGGYTVLMALAKLGVFAAGGCTYGVADLSQLQRITHKFEAGYLYGLTGTTENDCEEVFAARSPVNLADGIDCPVIFFQGLEDKVVPPEQSRNMVASLRERGVPVAYMEFEGEGHGFRTAETIVTVLESEYAFYARVLGLDVPGLRDVEIENFQVLQRKQETGAPRPGERPL